MKTIKEVIQYIYQTKLDTSIFLDSINFSYDNCRFYYCLKGYKHPIKGKKAHFTTSFAVRIAQQTGIWESWDIDKKEKCIEFINSFQRKDGFFYDKWIYKNNPLKVKNYVSYLLNRSEKPLPISKSRILNIQAETRQDFPILLNSGKIPVFQAPLAFNDINSIKSFFYSLNWEKPWSAGSHLSHQIVFLTINYKFYGLNEKIYNQYIDLILSLLNDIRDEKTGTWYTGNPSNLEKINGAMKIFTGLQWIERPYPDCSNLLDFAMNQGFHFDGCSFFNRLFVVYNCIKSNNEYLNRYDFKNFIIEVLEIIEKFKKDDKGFSFFIKKSQTKYYGVFVSKGLNESDLHGTSMIIWSVSIIAELLRLMDFQIEYWNLPLN
jgi:hypothetical protein